MAMKPAFCLYIGVNDCFLLDCNDVCVRDMFEEGYVFAAKVDTDNRHPNANILPTRAADADDIW